MTTTITGTDAELVTRLAAVRAGMEALHQALFASLPADDINECLEQFHASLLIMRRIVPNHVLDAAGQPLPTYATPPPPLTLIDGQDTNR